MGKKLLRAVGQCRGTARHMASQRRRKEGRYRKPKVRADATEDGEMLTRAKWISCRGTFPRLLMVWVRDMGDDLADSRCGYSKSVCVRVEEA